MWWRAVPAGFSFFFFMSGGFQYDLKRPWCYYGADVSADFFFALLTA
jgi:hypothetical protein